VAYVFSDWARAINLRWGADPDKLRVLHPGFPDPGPVDRAGRATFTFLFVGGDFERKGGFEVVEAFEDVWREHKHVRLVLAGSDPYARNPDRLVHSWVSAARRKHAATKLAELERQGALSRMAWTTRPTLDESFAAADAFVMPTHAEGFGFTNVEAMSHGLPVVTSTEGPSAEIVDDGRTGFLVRAGDVTGVREAMLRLVSDSGAARVMGEAARETFLRRFTLERFRTGLGALYHEALGR
jgi:glycosyltransferase involved in cell wall biosynthesis